MTEEILKAAIMQLRAKATERFGIIKDLYHRPATTETTDQIVKHAIALAQLEGAMITLQQYSGTLADQTNAEAESNEPEVPEEVTEVEVEELEEEPKTIAPPAITEKDTVNRSPTFRKTKASRAQLQSKANRDKLPKAKKEKDES